MSAQQPGKSAIESYLDENNVCAGFGKPNGNGLSNAPRGTGDDGCRALE
jgi:hypothetical protein